MTFRLTKHHGLGNDFLVHLTDDARLAADRPAWVERAQRWCHRHHGIGADGLLIGLHGTGRADLVMTLVNADGSVAEMSGNGIRCLAQAEAMRRNQEHGTLTIETDGGLRTVQFAATDTPLKHQGTIEASVDMQITRTPERRLRIGSVKVTLHLPEGVSTEAVDGCRDMFEDFCTVTASVRRGIDVEVAIAPA